MQMVSCDPERGTNQLLAIGELAIQLISLIFDNSPQAAFWVINSGAICRH